MERKFVACKGNIYHDSEQFHQHMKLRYIKYLFIFKNNLCFSLNIWRIKILIDFYAYIFVL